MAEFKDNKRKNGKLSLYPIKFDEAVKALLIVNPKDKTRCSKPQDIVVDVKCK